MILPLTRNTNPIWKQKFQNVKQISPEIKRLVRNMKETLELTSAVGLAAPQVGVPSRLFISNYGRLKETFINPKIIRYGKETNQIEEGCLSVPCTRGKVNRANEIELEYIDLKGNKKQARLSGYYARIAQHECDHLSSTFYLDRIIDKNDIYTYKPIKIIFFGTPSFGAIILKSLIGQQIVGEYKIPLVVTLPDKPSGRGQGLQASEVKRLAEEFNIPVVTPETLKDTKLIKRLRGLEPDFLVLSAYGKFLPREILEIPTKYPVNIHPSLLPKYRGPSPISTAILNGDRYTGVTVMVVSEKMDEGDILAAARQKTGSRDTTASLETKLASLGASLIHHVLHLATIGKIEARPQDHNKATYSKILKKEDGFIDWKNPPENLERLVRAYHPW
ncbi:MAG: hypothetical protein A2126_03350, partial [Candidatus Woykebacteria bacterium GWB1_45_5]